MCPSTSLKGRLARSDATSFIAQLGPRGHAGQFFNGSGRAWILVNFYFLSPSAMGVCHCSHGLVLSPYNDNRENATDRARGYTYLPTYLPTANRARLSMATLSNKVNPSTLGTTLLLFLHLFLYFLSMAVLASMVVLASGGRWYCQYCLSVVLSFPISFYPANY